MGTAGVLEIKHTVHTHKIVGIRVLRHIEIVGHPDLCVLIIDVDFLLGITLGAVALRFCEY